MPASPAHDDPDGLGLPYARAEFDDEGRYHVVCPACGEKCYPDPTATSEDDVTKGAGRAYAAHYTLMRPAATS
jgi:phage terminase large subunit GpA-like protein